MKDFIYAYVRKIPFKYDVNKKICNERLSYLESIKQNGIMKYYWWGLLEIAFEEKLGIDINELNPRRLDTGKYIHLRKMVEI